MPYTTGAHCLCWNPNSSSWLASPPCLEAQQLLDQKSFPASGALESGVQLPFRASRRGWDPRKVTPLPEASVSSSAQ